MMRLFTTVVVCSAAQNHDNNVTTYYNVEIKEIDQTEFDSNENAVFINLDNMTKKMYFEIKERYLQRKNDLKEECEVRLVSCDQSNKFDPKGFAMECLVIRENKEIQCVDFFNGFEFNKNLFKLNSCLVMQCFYDNNNKRLMCLRFNVEENTKPLVLDKNKNEKLIFILNFHIRSMMKKKSLKYEIPVDSFLKNPVFEVIREEGKEDKNSIINKDNQNAKNSNAVLHKLNTNLNGDVLKEKGEDKNEVDKNANINDVDKYESEKILIENEKSANENNNKRENNTKNPTALTNSSLKLSTKIAIGVVVSIVCLCILIGVYIEYKKRNIKHVHYTTINTEQSYYQV